MVHDNDKQRFALSDDGKRIRANQGHSVKVDLGLQAQAPPEFLYHGTVPKFIESIRSEGLHKGERHHVHPQPQPDHRDEGRRAARQSGDPRDPRQGDVGDGPSFYVSRTAFWLTDAVPPEFIDFP